MPIKFKNVGGEGLFFVMSEIDWVSMHIEVKPSLSCNVTSFVASFLRFCSHFQFISILFSFFIIFEYVFSGCREYEHVGVAFLHITARALFDEASASNDVACALLSELLRDTCKSFVPRGRCLNRFGRFNFPFIVSIFTRLINCTFFATIAPSWRRK